MIAASTGSGKTLAYTLPAVQNMAEQEQNGYARLPKRPRCLVLVPTRELATQVLDEVKQIGHFCKIASTAVLGGESHSTQKKAVNIKVSIVFYCFDSSNCFFPITQLDKLVDLVVASPGRLMMHKEQGNVHFSQVNTIIIDEVDTMLTQGNFMFSMLWRRCSFVNVQFLPSMMSSPVNVSTSKLSFHLI